MLQHKRILYLGLDPSNYRTDGSVTHWPIIQIVPRPLTDPLLVDALFQFPHYTHVVVTSKSTVSILHRHLVSLGMERLWKDKITLALGKVTASHLETIDIHPFKIAEEETGEGVVRMLESLSCETSFLFLPQSSQARPLIRQFLVERKIRHLACPLYDPIPHTTYPLPRLEEFTEIVFTSPSTVDAFWKVFGPPPPFLVLKTIGPVTARHLAAKLAPHKRGAAPSRG